jgi:thioredoxin-like negative regulator of GroEL
VETLTEAELLTAAAAAPRLVAHFFHPAFTRCAILDAHLATLAATHTRTRFVRVPAPDCPFLTARLGIRVLPALLSFVGGTCVGRCVGFDDYQPSSRRTAAVTTSGLPSFGGGASSRPDAFPTAAVEARLVEHGSVSLADAAAARAAAAAAADGCGDAPPPEHARRAIRKGGRGRGRGRGGSSDDDNASDWSD